MDFMFVVVACCCCLHIEPLFLPNEVSSPSARPASSSYDMAADCKPEGKGSNAI